MDAGRFISPVLAPAAWLFAAGSALRNAMFDHGLRRVHRPGAKVISVGGLMAGGSGKTPLTLTVARLLLNEVIPEEMWRDEIAPLAIVSRGYGRSTTGVQVVSDGNRVLLDADQGGDEPLLLAASLPGVPVVVAEDRVAGVKRAEDEFGARVVLLDDAFSHRRIARDLDILLLNSDLPRWWWRPLPAGRLREWTSQLGRADVLISEHTPAGEELLRWAEGVHGEQPLTLTVERAASHLTSLGLEPENGELESAGRGLGCLVDRPVLAATAIARPDRFVATLRRSHADVVDLISFSDHARWTRVQREKVMKRAAELARKHSGLWVVLTAKDAVKWPSSLEREGVELRVLHQSMELDPLRELRADGRTRRDRFLDRLRWLWETSAS